MSQSTIVIANLLGSVRNQYPVVNFPSPGTWYVRFNGDSTIYSKSYSSLGTMTSITVDNQGKGIVDVPPYSLLILSQ